MNSILIETKYKNPKKYTVKNKLDTVLITGEESAIINNSLFQDVVDIMEYAYSKLLAADGCIIVRLVAREYGDGHSVFEEKLPNFLENYIESDRVEFIAQCINDSILKDFCSIPFVETLLIGISPIKKPYLKNKVRFISMPDKLEKLPDSDEEHPFYQWTFRGVPFSREECLSQKIHADVEKEAIFDLHTYNFVPLNKSKYENNGISLGEFMMLAKNNFPMKVSYLLDQERHYFGQEIFDLYTKYLVKLKRRQKPDPKWSVIDDNAIVLNNQNPNNIESLLIMQPPPVIIPADLAVRNSVVSIMLKPEWRDKVDIEYVYIETRKSDFLNQFYYYLNQRAGVAINSATVLKARIRKLPSIERQRIIVNKAKSRYFSEQKKILKFHEEVLGIKRKDISHAVGGPLGQIKRLTGYLTEYFELGNSQVSLDTVIKESRHSFTIKDVLDNIYDNVAKGESWIRGLGLDINKPLYKMNIHSLLTGLLENISQRKFRFSSVFNLNGLENIFLKVNDNLEFVLENLYSNANRHAFSEKSADNILKVCWSMVRYQKLNYLNLSISNNGKPMETSLREFIAYGTKGRTSGNTGIGGNNIYEIVKSYNGFLGLKKWEKRVDSDISLTFDILLPVDDEFIVYQKIEDYKPMEIK